MTHEAKKDTIIFYVIVAFQLVFIVYHMFMCCFHAVSGRSRGRRAETPRRDVRRGSALLATSYGSSAEQQPKQTVSGLGHQQNFLT